MPSWLGLVALVALGTVVVLEAFYWIIRLAVRHGVRDAQRLRQPR